MTAAVVDLFAAGGGWDEGLRDIGVTDVIGLEWDKDACATAIAAGHHRVQVDVAQVDTGAYIPTMVGLIGSPPCTKFSPAGNGMGRAFIGLLADGIRAMFRGEDRRQQLREQIFPACLEEQKAKNAKRPEPKRWSRRKVEQAAHDEVYSIVLVLEPARFFVDALGADGPLAWLLLEQVTEVLPLWHVYQMCLREHGWSAWVGVLNSADYGVPQTRERAILIARRRGTATPPTPTHAHSPGGLDLFRGGLRPWVSMSDALGWPAGVKVISNYNNGSTGERGTRTGYEPSSTVTRRAYSMKVVPPPGFVLDRRQNSRGPRGTSVPVAVISLDRPAPTLTSQVPNAWVLRNGETAGSDGEELKLSIEDASVLQSFPADYPWQGLKGSQFLQCGNAVPPRLAAAIAATVVGAPVMAVAP